MSEIQNAPLGQTYQPGLEDLLVPQLPGLEGMIGRAGLEQALEKRRNLPMMPAPGLRREDFTDIPGSAQPHDATIEHATGTAFGAIGGGMPFAQRGAVGATGGKLPPGPPIHEAIRQVLTGDGAAVANFAKQHGLTDEQVKSHIDSNFSSPRYRAKAYQGYLAAKKQGTAESTPLDQQTIQSMKETGKLKAVEHNPFGFKPVDHDPFAGGAVSEPSKSVPQVPKPANAKAPTADDVDKLLKEIRALIGPRDPNEPPLPKLTTDQTLNLIRDALGEPRKPTTEGGMSALNALLKTQSPWDLKK